MSVRRPALRPPRPLELLAIGVDIAPRCQLGSDGPQGIAALPPTQALGDPHHLRVVSAWLLRPSHLPVASLLRSRTALSLARAGPPRTRRTIRRSAASSCARSVMSVRLSPFAVSTRTSRLISARMPSSCVTSSRANRDASSTMTVPTPLSSIRSSKAAKPGRVSMGSAPLTAASLNSPTRANPAAWHSPRWPPAVACRCPCPRRRWRPRRCGCRRLLQSFSHYQPKHCTLYLSGIS